MGGTLTGAFHRQLKVSGSTSLTDHPSISESINDPRLPDDLITEIFLRLPVKSLLKFKCISKPWLSRISSPEFIKAHFSTSCKEGESLKRQLLFSVMNATSCIKQCSVYSALHEAEPPTLVCDLEQLYEKKFEPISIVGIVNGLVCLAITPTQLCLWNPALRKFKDLPSPINLEPPFTNVTVNHGFGYDELHDDYKVVCVLMLCGSRGVFKDEVKVYSLRAGSWRRLNDDLKGLYPFCDAATYANGKMYWLADDVEASTLCRKIASLDMTSEKCGELEFPIPDNETCCLGWKLGGVCGRLYAVYEHDGTKLDMFVMDKDGGEECWRKVDSIPWNGVRRRTPWYHERVICFVSDDEIVIRNGHHGLLVYHRKNKETRNIEMDSFFRVVPYVESLVSPSPDGSNV